MKTKRFLAVRGDYLLAVLCIAVILLSAVWTRTQAPAAPSSEALSDESQRLAAVSPSPQPENWTRPVPGALVRGYDAHSVYFPALGLWHTHPALDFAVETGEPVLAILPGTVLSCDDGVLVQTPDGREIRYRGVTDLRVSPGQAVDSGGLLGIASGQVPWEENGRLCVWFGETWQPEEILLDK